MFKIPRRKLRRGIRHLYRINWILKNVIERPSIGFKNEQRFLRILQEYIDNGRHRKPWIRSLRPGSRHEDQRGIDFVFGSDVGDLFIQVKSSEPAKVRFEEEGRRRFRRGSAFPIVRVVVVNDRRSDGDILQDALRALQDLHETVQGNGSSYAPKRETG